MKILVAQNGKKKDILSKSLQEILDREGHMATFVAGAAKVLDEVYRQSPDVVFLYSGLRRPDCCDILKKIKSAPSTRDIPVFFVVSVEDRELIRRGFTEGLYDYLSVPLFPEEMAARLQNIETIRQKARELEEVQIRDYLTGIYNRKYFMERMQEEMEWARQYGEPIALIMVDIDFFKKINDTYGHGCGDIVLQEVARTLGGQLRPTDLLARFGGEEFIVLL
ncbi:MAG TPA: diguanylate cyclase, partial [Dissulfurispiraceae bacterium]|nr:diguanylate cyclase [Dissulfurispiraceae bacterium]